MKILRIPSAISRTAVLMIGLAAGASASAESFESLGSLNQSQFIEFSKNLSAATHYKAIAPPETMGLLGFDLGIEVSSTEIDSQLFDLASAGDFEGSELIIPRLHLHKGLPLGIDLGGSVGVIPDSDATIVAGELRFAIIDGGAVTPALGIRATYSQITGLDDLGLKSYGLELGISKGFLLLTPYAGIGIVHTAVEPESINGLMEDSYEQRKLVVGATVNVGVALTLEADRTGDFSTYSAKVGFRF